MMKFWPDNNGQSFNDPFSTAASPSSGNVTNIVNNWNYVGTAAGAGGLPNFNGSSFSGNSFSGYGGQCAQINRNKEKYTLNRPMNISYSFYNGYAGVQRQGIFSEFSIGGSTSALAYPGNYSHTTTSMLGGVSIFASGATDNASNSTVYIANNGTNLVTIGNYPNNTWWSVFLQFRNNTLSYAITSGAKPSSYSSVTLTDKTVSSNSAILLVGSMSGSDSSGTLPAAFDNFSALLL
jgi:hypothetical protein